ncbi:hypothetical protein [Curtobacterium flaccumfaciens]|uniref:hypothetical protein n=1 Tax=Curtobacterium flaccumfaciens TaxID=2035 RepID=UPI001BDE3104|nr:hypothetical protein [Curtobacterium flaccumfaciens]MBT1672834.1 hypothetical protein [Curtobacterium flaccumfaciens pv. flaccumfaciens]
MNLNSFDEWSQLREIVVGSAQNYISHERELSFDLFFHDNLAQDNTRYEWYYPRLTSGSSAENGRVKTKIKTRYVEELNEDVQGLAETLGSLGVRVLRPMDLDQSTGDVATLAWSASVVPPLNLRDIALVVGDEVIETPPMVRSRYFENQFLKPIYNDYFARGGRWTVMPRPIMTDASFDTSYADDATHSAGGPTEPIDGRKQVSPYDVGFEMLFDGAQVLRLGTDLMVNVSTKNHEMACDWLERHLEGRFNIHRVHAISDSHIDSMVIALRPGLLLLRSPDIQAKLPDWLQKWDYIVPPVPEANNFPSYDDDDIVLTSKYIDMNVLSVNEDTVLVNEASPELRKLLEQRGFDAVPVRHRHRRLFGGGFHCFTLDTVRDGTAESYR